MQLTADEAFAGFFPSRHVSPDLVARWANELAAPWPYRWWVAEDYSKIIGLTGIGASRDPLDATLGELDTIAVHPDHRRRGVGRALMNVAVKTPAC
ncbi:MAG: GNAT family N-acetyltransferase [Pseudonocardiaceae bacterium]